MKQVLSTYINRKARSITTLQVLVGSCFRWWPPLAPTEARTQGVRNLYNKYTANKKYLIPVLLK